MTWVCFQTLKQVSKALLHRILISKEMEHSIMAQTQMKVWKGIRLRIQLTMGKLKQEAMGKLAPGQNKSKIHQIAMEL